MMTVMTASAQQIQIVDNNGDGIPLVSVLTEEGVLIGTTDLDGRLADVKGAAKVAVTHVAYKPQLVTVASLKEGRVTMEDLGYNLAEIVVKPKPYIYVETYYRVYVYRNDSLGYFRCGIMPNAFDPQTKKLEHGSYSNATAEYYASLGVYLTWGIRAEMNKAGQVRAAGVMNKEGLKKRYFITTDDSNPKRWVYSNPEGTVGQVVFQGDQVRTTIDAGKAQMYANKAKGETKMLKKREDIDYEYLYTLIGDYRENEAETDITSFIMNTDHWEYTDKKGHAKYIIECYATDRGYMDKAEWKAKKKELKVDYKKVNTIEGMEAYERRHNIPALPASVRQALGKLKHY